MNRWLNRQEVRWHGPWPSTTNLLLLIVVIIAPQQTSSIWSPADDVLHCIQWQQANMFSYVFTVCIHLFSVIHKSGKSTKKKKNWIETTTKSQQFIVVLVPNNTCKLISPRYPSITIIIFFYLLIKYQKKNLA